jgi:hypothetical protein
LAGATSAQQFVKLPQFVEDTTEGTFPSSSPSFTSCGSCTSLDITKNNAVIPIGQVGSEDVLDIAAGTYSYQLSMRAQLIDSSFAKRFINAVNWATPTGTIAATTSMIYSQYIFGATENFIKITSARPKRATLELSTNSPIVATYEMEAMNVAKPITTANGGLTTPSFASNPSGAVWVHTDGGAGPLVWNSIALNLKQISVTFERNTTAEPIIGQNTPYGTLPHLREITGSFTVLYTAQEATTLETDFDSNASRTMVWTLKSATSTLTFTGAEITNYTRAHAADDANALVEVCQFRAKAAVLT